MHTRSSRSVFYNTLYMFFAAQHITVLECMFFRPEMHAADNHVLTFPNAAVHLLDAGPPQEGHELCTGAVIVRAKEVTANAVGDSITRCPLHSFRIVGALAATSLKSVLRMRQLLLRGRGM